MVGQRQWWLLGWISTLALSMASKKETPLSLQVHGELMKLKKLGEIPLAVECCQIEKVLPHMFSKFSNQCFELANDVATATTDIQRIERGCRLLDCVLAENKMLKADVIDDQLVIDDQEFRKKLLKNSRRDMKEVNTDAMDACFKVHDSATERGTCKSGSVQLVTCLLFEILSHCPKGLWHFYSKEECRDL